MAELSKPDSVSTLAKDRARSIPLPVEGRQRVIIAGVGPRIDDAHSVKRCVGDVLIVTADLVCDGHDRVAGVLRYRRPNNPIWAEKPLVAQTNDRFAAELPLHALGRWELAIEGWLDAFGSWRHGLARKAEAGEATDVDFEIGALLLREAAERALASDPEDAQTLRDAADAIGDRVARPAERLAAALADGLRGLVDCYPDRSLSSCSLPWPVTVDPVHARFAAWYELFPRSTGESGAHGTFESAQRWLPYIAGMGFDVLYLPPIHPIGKSFRKGPNNTLQAGPEDPGSPWAIGSENGGHTAIHPALGTLADFDHFLRRADEHGLQVAIDIAFQASPDHPWITEHPEWFKRRPDGTLQYAENPPKKYQDVHPFDFECADWRSLWSALRDVFLFWIERGVTIFRVDNPHTKPIQFWEWCIASVKERHPEATFLSEAFTRPKLKYSLAKIGFTQGYTYFTWRHTAAELRTYLTELTQTEVADYFRPSFWPNTPDILPEDLQFGGRPAFIARLILAGTLSSHYGIYGPAFELMEHVPREGSGEYVDSEKFELRRWNLDAPESLRPIVTALNRLRRAHPALQRNETLHFHDCDNDRLLCYSKRTGDDIVLAVVNLDFHHRQSGWVSLDLAALGLSATEGFQAHDLLGGGRFLWTGARNFVEIDPTALPAHLFAIRRKVRTEQDFDYFM